jgi:ERCC4-type nuclease
MENTLYVDTREPKHIQAKFQSMAEDYPNLKVQIKKLDTGDFQWKYGIIERKSIDDFISSMTTKRERKDKTQYQRLEEQLNRLKELDLPIKIILIHGKLEDCHSQIHHHSVLGQIASIQAQGINVMWITENMDWPYLIYRLIIKSIKYC